MDFRFTSAALQELREAVLYYENAENGLGSRFLNEVEGAVARILEAPEAWRMLSLAEPAVVGRTASHSD